jgi:hypothetical protein
MVLSDPKFDDACDIPEMAALASDQAREFVWLYAHNGQNIRAAAAEAGYSERNGHYLIKRQDVTDALQAIAKRLMHGGVVLAINVALSIMEDPTNSAGDRLSAAKVVLDRGGFGPRSEQHIKVEKVMGPQERLASAMSIAEKLGVPLERLLGPNRTPAITLVAEETQDLSDILGPADDEI